MAEEKATPKSRIETLSDMVFGLALSIGALTLIGNAPKTFNDLLTSIGYYAFSFLILITVWYSYTRTVSNVRVESEGDVVLNVSLLFLVSIEPFLFNELITPHISAQYISAAYAIDLGGLFAIQALLANSIVSDKKKSEQVQCHYKAVRNSQIVGAAIFFISALPIFWTLAIPLNSTTSIPLRFLLWIIPLFVRFIRRIWERKEKLDLV